MNELARTLEQALRAGGKIMLAHFGRARIRYKGRANIVTQADTQSQAAILALIKRRFPGHDYWAEEDAVKETGSRFLWIIDPLDGTTNYAHGYPASCVSIGLLKDKRPIFGGVYDPFRGELFFAQKGGGALLNGERIHVSRVPKLEESLLVTGFAYDRAERSHFYVEQFRRFMVRCHDVRRSGTAALDMAWVAAGRVDGFWEFYLNPWDVAAGMLLVEEAGGRVADFSGRPWTDPKTFGRQTLATNGRIHGAMLRLLKPREVRE